MSIGKENELASFYTTTEVTDSQGGITATYVAMSLNPVWCSVVSKRGTTRGLENGEVAFYAFKEIRFRVNELWTPTKNMTVEIRNKKYAILSIDDDNLEDDYYFLTISEIDHA